MDDPLPPEDTSSLVHRLDGGDSTVIDPLLSRHHDKYVAMARDQRHRYGLSAAEYDDDDAAADAGFAFWESATSGKLGPLGTRAAYWARIRALLDRAFRRVRDRLRRQKRGGSGIPRPGTRRPLDGTAAGRTTTRGIRLRTDFDDLEDHLPPIPPVENWVDDADEFEHLLKCLDGKPHFREVLLLTRDGDTPGEIADRLGIAPRTVRRKLVLIRATMVECGFASRVDPGPRGDSTEGFRSDESKSDSHAGLGT